MLSIRLKSDVYKRQAFNRSATLLVGRYFFLFCVLSGTAGVLCFLALRSSDVRRRRLEDEYQELKQKMRTQEEKNQLVTDRLRKEEGKTKALITDISHQLKNPLASLKMSYEDVYKRQYVSRFILCTNSGLASV